MAMARRQSGGADDVLDRIALVPWWLSVLLAVASFGVMNTLARIELPPLDGSPTAEFTVRVMIKSLATAAQYVLPLLFVGMALLSVLRRRQLARMLNLSDGTDGGTGEEDFIALVAEAYQMRGFDVIPAPRNADDGIDMVLRKGHLQNLVVTRHWQVPRVGVQVVRELAQRIDSGGADGGVVLTAGRFTSEAAAYARSRRIELIDAGPLARMLQQARAAMQEDNWLATRQQIGGPDFRATVPQRACPVCGSAMIERVERQGEFAGMPYWGCVRFPTCQGRRRATE